MGRVADATAPAPGYPRDSVGRSDDAIAFATARELQQRGTARKRGRGRATATLQRVRSCPAWWWAHGGCAVDPASLLLATTAFGRGARVATPRRRSLSERAQAPCARPAPLSDHPPGEPVSRRLDLRRLRLKAVWLLIIPFYIFSAPSANLLWWGAGMSAAGLSLRAWAAGSIRKDRELATTGPYAHTRNPLYLGSFLLGAGVTIAGGQWVFGVAFFALFLLVYRATALREATELEVRFGEGYRAYAAQVPGGVASDHPVPVRGLRLAAGRFLPSPLPPESRMGGGARSDCGLRSTGFEAEALALTTTLLGSIRSLLVVVANVCSPRSPGPSRPSRRGGAPCPRIASDGPARRCARPE